MELQGGKTMGSLGLPWKKIGGEIRCVELIGGPCCPLTATNHQGGRKKCEGGPWYLIKAGRSTACELRGHKERQNVLWLARSNKKKT